MPILVSAFFAENHPVRTATKIVTRTTSRFPLFDQLNREPNPIDASTAPHPTTTITTKSKVFSDAFRNDFRDLLRFRRDVRRFDKDRPVPEDMLQEVLHVSFNTAPSVGLSEPWRIVRVESPEARQKVLQNFEICNAEALRGYYDSNGNNQLSEHAYHNVTTANATISATTSKKTSNKAELYASLKLTGMKESPVQLAIFCDDDTPKGSGLGVRTMAEMRRYSVVCAIQSFWLLARSTGLAVGWVSILDPEQLKEDLGLNTSSVKSERGSDDNDDTGRNDSSSWKLVGYLCVGYPDEKEVDASMPELERFGWEQRRGKQQNDNELGNSRVEDDFDFYRQLPLTSV